MHPDDIHKRLTALPRSVDLGKFPLEFLIENIYISRSGEDEPCLVLLYDPSMRLPAGRRTRGLLLTFHESFLFTIGETTATSRCAVLRCLDPDLIYYFCLMVGGLVRRSYREPGCTGLPSVLLEYVDEWQELLVNRREFTVEEQLGLWGELWLLLQCPSPDGAVSSWLGPKAKTFDFSANRVDLDVKTSLVGHSHHFSLDQLQTSPSGNDRVICSIRVTEDPAGGVTVDDLVSNIRGRLSDPGWFEELLLRSHYQNGTTQLRLTTLEAVYVPVQAVPSVHADPGVSQVRFVSDLSHCPALASPQVRALLSQLTA